LKRLTAGHHDWGIVVAPRAGAWIETKTIIPEGDQRGRSPPARGRGLKHLCPARDLNPNQVAPRAGAWIETRGCHPNDERPLRRPPRGGVD